VEQRRNRSVALDCVARGARTVKPGGEGPRGDIFVISRIVIPRIVISNIVIANIEKATEN
jgi:hypothetical protein